MKLKLHIAALAVGLFASLPALADNVEETRVANPDARVEFIAVNGTFEVVGHDGDTIELNGKLGSDVEELLIAGDETHWTVELKMKESKRFNLGFTSESDLTLMVPRGGQIEARVVSADLMLRNLDGDQVEAATVSGTMKLENVQPRELRVQSVSGDIESDAGGTERSRAQSVSGDVILSLVSGDVEVQSVSGDIEVNGDAISEFEAETVSGDLDVALRPLPTARMKFSSHSGDIVARLPADTGVRLSAETFSGDLDSNFGGNVEHKSRGPGASLEHESGNGDVRVEANTFSGSFSLSKLQ